MKNISKEYPGVLALDHVNFGVKRGEIHALVGENGAGKSTLMNVLSGVCPHGTYSGEIIFENNVYEVRNIRQSEDKGIAIIHQEFALSPYLSIAENIFLGNEKSRAGVINWHKTRVEAEKLTAIVGLDDDVDTPIEQIGVGKRQLVEIVKAISKNIKLLILDEPTAALNEHESENLLKLLKKLKEQGLTSILISHKLNEVIEIADTVTILRDGKAIETLDNSSRDVSENRIIKGMVGRDLVNRFPKRNASPAEVLLEVKNWNAYHPQHTDRKIIKDISMNVRRGEVVGIAGLMGAGRTEFAMSLFGRSYGTGITGEVFINGQKADVGSVRKAIESGLAYISEDRKGLGLILINSVKDNITLANLKEVTDGLTINENKEVVASEDAVGRFKIKCSSITQNTRNLSGGNQQKVVLSKWLFCDSEVFILDEPTRGIDVGAKYDVYKVINELAEKGRGILLISSELPEILGMCDRIYIMSEGAFVGEMSAEEATQEEIMSKLV